MINLILSYLRTQIPNVLAWSQPFAVIVFLISGVCCLLLKQWNQGIINLLFGIVNFFVFYGDKVFR